MAFKSDRQRKRYFANVDNRPSGLSNSKINALSKDEHMAHQEYGDLAVKSSNLKIKRLFKEMSADEKRHAKYLKVIKHEVNES